MFLKRYKKILVPVDGSEQSLEAFEQALSLAIMVKGEITIIHIVETSFYGSLPFELSNVDSAVEVIKEETKNRITLILDRLVQKAHKIGVSAKSKMIKGNIANEIVNESKKHDLIIMGSMGQNALSTLLLGSIAEKVARHACCPVMLVREQEKM